MHKTEYFKPEMEEIDISFLSVVCSSPEDGENEDIDFEDWDFR